MGNPNAQGKGAIDPKRFVPVTEVAEALQINYYTVVDAIADGILPIGIVIPSKKGDGKTTIRVSRKKWQQFKKEMGL